MFACAKYVDDRLGELTRCITEMCSGWVTAEEESEVRGDRKYLQYCKVDGRGVRHSCQTYQPLPLSLLSRKQICKQTNKHAIIFTVKTTTNLAISWLFNVTAPCSAR